MRSSCKGLLLCQRVGRSGDGENEYYVCNPATKELYVLSQSTYSHGPESNLVLAFEPSPFNCVENYKVICSQLICSGTLKDEGILRIVIV